MDVDKGRPPSAMPERGHRTAGRAHGHRLRRRPRCLDRVLVMSNARLLARRLGAALFCCQGKGVPVPMIEGKEHHRRVTNSSRVRPIPALTLAALSLVAACSSGSPRSANPAKTPGFLGSGGGPTSTLTTPRPTTLPPEMLSAGQIGQRTDIPWPLVGPGWLLVLHQSRPPTIALVDPQGGRYDIAPAPAGLLVDWSGDGHRALFQSHCGRCSVMDTETLIDLQTGALQDLTLPGSLAFTRPNGLALLQYGFNDGPIRRLTLNGDPQLTYPTSFPGAGTTTGQLVSAPDGSQLAVLTTNGYQIVTNAGGPVRLITPPLPINSCYLEQWLSDDKLLVRCQGNFWALPVNGGAPSNLTRATSDNLVSLTPIAYGFAGQAHDYGQCRDFLDQLHGDGTTSRMNVPVTTQNGYIRIVGTYQNRIAITYSSMSADCLPEDPVTLGWYDPAANTAQPLLTESTGGSGLEVFLFGDS